MFKKAAAAVALATLALLAAPAAANAYTSSTAEVSGDAVPNGTVTVDWSEGSFPEDDILGIQVTGEGTAVLGVFKAASVQGTTPVADDGSASHDITFPADAKGTYNVSVVGNNSRTVGTVAITVSVPADGAGSGATPISGGSSASGQLPSTGYDAPLLLIWGAAGALMLGVALVLVLNVVRRQRASL